jgi:hypothetical protein
MIVIIKLLFGASFDPLPRMNKAFQRIIKQKSLGLHAYAGSIIAVPRTHPGKRPSFCPPPWERMSPATPPEYEGDGLRFPLRRIKHHERMMFF